MSDERTCIKHSSPWRAARSVRHSVWIGSVTRSKLHNVLGHLPEDTQDQPKSTFKTTFKLNAMDGKAQIKLYATLAPTRLAGLVARRA